MLEFANRIFVAQTLKEWIMESNQTPEMVENVVYDEIYVGQSAQLVRTLSLEDIQAFAAVSGDTNPAHLDEDFAKQSLFHEIIGHGMWSGSLISTVLGTVFPGFGTIYLNQTLQFKRPVKIGDTLTVIVTVTAKNDDKKSLILGCVVNNQHHEKVVVGEASVLAPTTKIRREKINAPQIHLFDPDARLRDLLAMGADLEPITCGVVHPCDEDSLRGAINAAEENLIIPILIGPEAKIKEIATRYQIDISSYTIISVPHSHAAAEIAASMASKGEVEALMKGSLHTDELLHAVISNPALRTKRRLSHISRFELPLYNKPILISDAAINIKPSLQEKVDITQNAINLAHILGCAEPKVAILSAVETVTPSIPSTLDAAALCKMADRGQIFGAKLDGPLAFDNAISPKAVRIKHIHSEVAGEADILIVPDLESGNMLMKQLEYFAGGSTCGVVLGCKVPIALTSRADGASTRMASALLAKLVAHHYRIEKP